MPYPPSDPWSVWLPSRSLSGSPAVPRLVGTLRASFLALRAPSGRMTRQAKDEGRSAEMTDGPLFIPLLVITTGP